MLLTVRTVSKSLADIHGRIPEMDKHGVEHLILSLTSPGPQGQGEKDKAEALAKRANDVRMLWLPSSRRTVLN
jgi:hypothetical protein